jgi:hypothetical protein
MSAIPTRTSKLEQLNIKAGSCDGVREPKTAPRVERLRRKILS